MTMTAGKEALIQLLRSEGVKYVFGIPGATEILFMDALEKAEDIKYIQGHSERTCSQEGVHDGKTR